MGRSQSTQCLAGRHQEATVRPVKPRPKGTLEDLTMLDKGIRAQSSFYPSKDHLWKKAQILGISRPVFNEWAAVRRWYQT